MRVLDLFSGSESLRKPAEDLGHDYFSVENDCSFNPDLCADISLLPARDVPFKPDVIWASPPCTCFSIASVSTHWNTDKTPKTKQAQISLNLVEKTIDLVEQLNPKYYYIENPRGMLRKMAVVSKLPIRHTVTYCQYGDTRMKPTDIWTNNPHWLPRPMCKNGDTCHEAAPRGSKTGTQGLAKKDRSKVPYELLCEILESSQ